MGERRGQVREVWKCLRTLVGCEDVGVLDGVAFLGRDPRARKIKEDGSG